MGEAHDYEQMEAMMAGEQSQLEQDARARIEQEAVTLENNYADGPQNYWQPGCPFVLKDIVHYKNGAEKLEGKVVGLPTVEDAAADNARKDPRFTQYRHLRSSIDPQPLLQVQVSPLTYNTSILALQVRASIGTKPLLPVQVQAPSAAASVQCWYSVHTDSLTTNARTSRATPADLMMVLAPSL